MTSNTQHEFRSVSTSTSTSTSTSQNQNENQGQNQNQDQNQDQNQCLPNPATLLLLREADQAGGSDTSPRYNTPQVHSILFYYILFYIPCSILFYSMFPVLLHSI